jgi:hypothetical protein
VSGVDLVTFLRARLDEREAAARAANPSPWRRITNQEPRLSSTTIFGASYLGDQEKLRNVCNVELSWERDANAAHIVLNDPAFVLADVAAKRRILSDVYEPLRELESAIQDENDTGEDPSINWHEVSDRLLCALAAPFAQHPDFDPAWVVEA